MMCSMRYRIFQDVFEEQEPGKDSRANDTKECIDIENKAIVLDMRIQDVMDSKEKT